MVGRVSRRNSRSKRVKSNTLRRKTSRRKSLRRKSLRRKSLRLKSLRKRHKGGSEPGKVSTNLEDATSSEIKSLGFSGEDQISPFDKKDLLPCIYYEKEGFLVDCDKPIINGEYYIFYKAIYDYRAQKQDELDLNVGEYIIVPKRNHFEGGWWYGIKLEPIVYKRPDVISGWFPSNYVEHDANAIMLLDTEYLKAEETEMSRKAAMVSPPNFNSTTETPFPKPPTITPRKESLKHFTAINKVRKKALGILHGRQTAP